MLSSTPVLCNVSHLIFPWLKSPIIIQSPLLTSFIALCDESPKIAICTQHMMFGCFRDSGVGARGIKISTCSILFGVFNITITVVICGNTKRYMVSSGGMISVPERYSFQPKIPTHNDRK